VFVMNERLERLVCIICPNSCEMEVRIRKGNIKEIEGNLCPKGEEYVKSELFNPKRIVTSTVVVLNGEIPLVSVKTSRGVPKEKIFDVMDEISKIEINAPVKLGDVILRNVANTGADIIATRNVDKKQ